MKSLFYFLFSTLIGTAACAQFQKPDVTLPSSNAAALSKYGDIPVSYYTGTSQVSIPLLSINEGSIQLPVQLQYHGSGVRVNEHPGWVGLNWSLQAGGYISRKVKDVPDDFEGSPFLGNPRGFYFRYASLRSSSWETRSFVETLANTSPNNIYDTEPDELSLPPFVSQFSLESKLPACTQQVS